MSCHVAWGQHTCKHAEGHAKRRHMCSCGSWPGERIPTTHTSPESARLVSAAMGSQATGGGGDLSPVASAHRPT